MPEERLLTLIRRSFCFAVLAVACAFSAATARAQSIAMAELMKPNPLGEMELGDPKAPVTIVEYASMTCPHCARFHAGTYPKLKSDYIDKGKVRFLFREFPLDPLALAGFALARCVADGNKDKYFTMIDVLFAQQDKWLPPGAPNPVPPLRAIMRQAGMNDEQFNACLANQKLADGISAVRQHAADKLGVNSTPTFFVNGVKATGEVSIEQMAKLMEPYLKEK
jgi:protein-disulfide isomerase